MTRNCRFRALCYVMFIIRRLYSLQGSIYTFTLLYSVSALLFADEETYSFLDSVAVRRGCESGRYGSYRLHLKSGVRVTCCSHPSFPHEVTVCTSLTVSHGVPSPFHKPTLGPQAGWGVPNAGPGVHLLSSPVSKLLRYHCLWSKTYGMS